MRKWIVIILVCAALIGGGFYYYQQNMTQAKPVVNAISDFEFETFSGEAKRLYDFKGKIILINFWASWCAPCVVEFPVLMEMARKHGDKVVVLAFSADEKPVNADRFAATLEDMPDNMILIRDHSKTVSLHMFGTALFPESYILDADMVLRKKIVGNVQGDELDEFIPSE